MKVPVYVPIRSELTADVLPPAVPPFACSDARGRATICNEALAGWLNAYDKQLDLARTQLTKIRNLQPKPEGGP